MGQTLVNIAEELGVLPEELLRQCDARGLSIIGVDAAVSPSLARSIRAIVAPSGRPDGQHGEVPISGHGEDEPQSPTDRRQSLPRQSFSSKISVRLLEAPVRAEPTTIAVLRDAWLPMFLWQNVPVIRQIHRKLTAVERFLLEAALRLGQFGTDNIQEITSIPPLAVHRIARRLASQRALVVTPDKCYASREHETQAALEREAVIECHEDKLTFAFLPLTGDLLAFGERANAGDAPRLDGLRPFGKAPVPHHFGRQKVREFLRERVQERSVIGLPGDITEVVEAKDDTEIGITCPAFRVSGRIDESDEQLRVNLQLHGRRTRNRGRDQDGIASVPLRLDGSAAQVQEWLALARCVGDHSTQEAVWAVAGPPECRSRTPQAASRSAGIDWTFPVSGQIADAIVQSGRSLVQPTGVALTSGDACVAINVTVAPSDSDAAARFVIDDVVAQLQDVNAIDQAEIERCLANSLAARKADLSKRAGIQRIRGRLWQLKQFRQIYAWREAEDFAYGN